MSITQGMKNNVMRVARGKKPRGSTGLRDLLRAGLILKKSKHGRLALSAKGRRLLEEVVA